jgi:hypothetical protein
MILSLITMSFTFNLASASKSFILQNYKKGRDRPKEKAVSFQPITHLQPQGKPRQRDS